MSNKQTKKPSGKKILSAEAWSILSEFAPPEPDGKPLKKENISKGENGRPFFLNKSPGNSQAKENSPIDFNMDFNISHSENMVAVSFVQNKNEKTVLRTGCDIQLIKPRANADGIAEDYFTQAERDYIFQDGKTQAGEVRFFHIWSLKECFIKLKGLSVFNMAEVPSFIHPDASSRHKAAGSNKTSDCFCFCTKTPSPITFYLYELFDLSESYVFVTAIETHSIEGSIEKPFNIQPQICWFSHPSLTIKKIAEINSSAFTS